MSHITINPHSLYYGFPVVLLTNIDTDGNTNISPISSNWSLGHKIVIGIGTDGKAYENIQSIPAVVLNVASNNLMRQIENIAKYTGKKNISEEKKSMGYSFSDDKFRIGGFTRQTSANVRPHKIHESKLQIEASVENITTRDWFAIVELEILSTHADESILKPNNRIDPLIWNPLIYNFRSYHGLSKQVGRNFRFEN